MGLFDARVFGGGFIVGCEFCTLKVEIGDTLLVHPVPVFLFDFLFHLELLWSVYLMTVSLEVGLLLVVNF